MGEGDTKGVRNRYNGEGRTREQRMAEKNKGQNSVVAQNGKQRGSYAQDAIGRWRSLSSKNPNTQECVDTCTC